jgi:uncharacterized SAM-binding protein YcdF (DUF218 family)
MTRGFAPHRIQEAPKKRHGFAKFLLALVVLYALGFVVFAFSLPGKPEAPRRADGIVALTGGNARLDAAETLLENGEGRRLLISGVHPGTTKADIKRITQGGARFDCCTDLGFSASDTRGNALETAQWAHQHHYRSLIVVTASYHMPRSLNEFSAAMPDVRLVPYPVEPNGVDLTQWWRDPGTLKLLQSEYAKYLASLVATTFAGGNKDAGPERDARADSHHS